MAELHIVSGKHGRSKPHYTHIHRGASGRERSKPHYTHIHRGASGRERSKPHYTHIHRGASGRERSKPHYTHIHRGASGREGRASGREGRRGELLYTDIYIMSVVYQILTINYMLAFCHHNSRYILYYNYVNHITYKVL